MKSFKEFSKIENKQEKPKTIIEEKVIESPKDLKSLFEDSEEGQLMYALLEDELNNS
jgi:hypothetical protein